MNILEQIIKLLEQIFGKGIVAKNIGTRTNVVRFPKGPQGLDPTTRHYDVVGTAQKNPELLDVIKNSIEDRIPDLSKMNDQELLNYKQNLQRLADYMKPADVVEASSKQPVTGEKLKALTEAAGQTNPPGTIVENIESRINKLKQMGQEMEKTTGEKATLGDVLKDLGASQQSMSRMHDEGLVRATARQILINDIKAGKIKNIKVEDAINMKEPIDPFRQIYGEGALEQLDSLIPDLRGLKTEMDAEKLARSKFKFEPDETRPKGSVSIEEGKKAEQEYGINKPKEAEVTNITARVNKNKDLDSLIDEYNKNHERLSLTDQEGGTLIGYEEFTKLQNRNKEIENILDSLGVKSAEEVKPEGIVIPFKKKNLEPEEKADGGSAGLDYLLGFDNRPQYAGGGDVKKILDLIAKANKELKSKKSMETINPKTGEVIVPKEPIKIAEKEYLKSKTIPELQAEYKKVLARYEGAMGVLNKDKMNFEDFKNEVQRLAKIGDDIKAEYQAKKAIMEKTPLSDFEQVNAKYRKAANAAEEVFPNFKDPKTAAQELAEVMAEQKYGAYNKDFSDLPRKIQSELYNEAYNYINEINKLPKRAPGNMPVPYEQPVTKTTSNIDEDFFQNEFKQAMQEGVKKSNEMKAMGLDPSKSKDYDKFLEMESIKQKYGNVIDDNLLQQILIDDNPQRKAEVLASIDEALKMQEKGISPEEIINIIKNTTRTKQADGGPIGLDYLLGL